jgi:hypothetical protein
VKAEQKAPAKAKVKQSRFTTVKNNVKGWSIYRLPKEEISEIV